MIAQRIETNDRSRIASQNANAQRRKKARQKSDNGGQIKNGSINMNQLGGKPDSVLMRKEKAQKKAMKVVGDAWAADKKVDLKLEKRKDHIQELKDDIDEYMRLIDECNAHKEELRETYGITDDNEEQNTEYLLRVSSIDSDIGRYNAEIDEANEKIVAENYIIRAIRLERLKDHNMVDAQKEADEIMKDAGKEIIGMLAGEAQDHIDEKLEEKIEDAKEEAKEKEEKEEKLEEQRAEKEKQQAQLEIKQEENREAEKIKAEQRQNARKQADLLGEIQENMVSPTSNAAEAQAQIREMLQRMKLLEEDIKGANVDKKVED